MQFSIKGCLLFLLAIVALGVLIGTLAGPPPPR